MAKFDKIAVMKKIGDTGMPAMRVVFAHLSLLIVATSLRRCSGSLLNGPTRSAQS